MGGTPSPYPLAVPLVNLFYRLVFHLSDALVNADRLVDLAMAPCAIRELEVGFVDDQTPLVRLQGERNPPILDDYCGHVAAVILAEYHRNAVLERRVVILFPRSCLAASFEEVQQVALFPPFRGVIGRVLSWVVFSRFLFGCHYRLSHPAMNSM